LHIPRNLQNISAGDLPSSLLLNSLNHPSNIHQISSLNLNNNLNNNTNNNLVNSVITENLTDLNRQKLSSNNTNNIQKISKIFSEEKGFEPDELNYIIDAEKISQDHSSDNSDSRSCKLVIESLENIENIRMVKNETNEEKNEGSINLTDKTGNLIIKLNNLKGIFNLLYLKVSEKNNFIFINQPFFTNKQFQEEDLGFDPWGESTKALQDLMKIEKTFESNDEERSQFLTNNYINNSSTLINIPKNLSSTNKSLINHVDFLQKQFQAQQLNLENSQDRPDNSSSSNQFSAVNQFVKTKSQLNHNSFVNLNMNEDPSIINRNLNDQEYNANIHKFSILSKANNDNNINEINNKHYIFQSLPLNNNTNNIHNNNLSSINSNPVIPPPGFSINSNSVNMHTINQTTFLTPSSSTGSASSSNSSSLNNSASSTPAIPQANVLLQPKSIVKFHQSLLSGKKNI
jgi:hypothetical protein